jgi:hypothetical protein
MSVVVLLHNFSIHNLVGRLVEPEDRAWFVVKRSGDMHRRVLDAAIITIELESVQGM